MIRQEIVAFISPTKRTNGRRFGLAGLAFSAGDPSKLIKTACDLNGVERRFLDFIDCVGDAKATGQDTFVNQVPLAQ